MSTKLVANSSKIKLTEAQRKDFLKDFPELEMQKELKILFEKIYGCSVYILQGNNEFGKDLIIAKKDPMSDNYISVVVKMKDVSGAVRDSKIVTIERQIEQSFAKKFMLNDSLGEKEVNEVYVVLLGKFSNIAQENLDIFISQRYPKRVQIFDITKMDDLFFKYYPEVYYGASGLEALNNKVEYLEGILTKKDRNINSSFIEPTIKRYGSDREKEISLANMGSDREIKRAITENIFGVNETIDSMLSKIDAQVPKKIILEGSAGSGKSVFLIKLSQRVLGKSIENLDVSRKEKKNTVKVPVYLPATSVNGRSISELVKDYYDDSTYEFKCNLIIIDGLDEVSSCKREIILNECENFAKEKSASLIFSCRRNYQLSLDINDFLHYETHQFETAQAIDYIKKLAKRDDRLLDCLMKGIEQIESQIPLYPMALSLLVEIVKEHNEIPASISEIYTRYINISLGEKDFAKGIEVLFEYKMKKNFMSDMAYTLFFEKNRVVINYSDFIGYIDVYLDEHPHILSKENFISEIKRSSLLDFDGNSVFFMHKSYLDYFVSEFFILNRDEIDDAVFDKIHEIYFSDDWDDVTYFFFGRKTRVPESSVRRIISIGREKQKNTGSPLPLISMFMLGKLVQYAWDSKKSVKKDVIENAINTIMPARKIMKSFLIDKSNITDLPEIAFDAAILHLFNSSYSSAFLIREVEELINTKYSMIKSGEIVDESKIESVFYFTSFFVIHNYSALPTKESARILQNLIDLEEIISDKEITIPILSLLTVLIKKGSFKADNEVIEKLEEELKKLRKKNQDIVSRTFLNKKKNETPYYLRKF